MGSITAGTIVTSVALDLRDPTYIHWTSVELYDYLSQAQRAVCARVPSAYSKWVNMTLVDGFKQPLPANGSVLLDIMENTADNSPIFQTDMVALSIETPAWRAASAYLATEWMYSISTPLTYFINPPYDLAGDPNSNSIYGAVAYTPADVTLAADVIDVKDMFEPALKSYMLFLALSKEGTGQATDKAATYFEAFTNTLGTK